MVPIKKVSESGISDTEDILAVEEPLEIRLEYGPAHARIQKSISVTMRTPGNDAGLAIGFLYTEGIIKSITEIRQCSELNENVIKVSLAETVIPDIARLERNFYTSSSCGVCGKSSIESVRTVCNILDSADALRFTASVIYQLPDLLRKQQAMFESTGGIHACALFNEQGELLLSREDVGRHNALDKLIGAALSQGVVPLDRHLLLLSGRASFELVQKAAMAGIKVVAAVGAPSSLAVEMAADWGITLIGFLRGERFNIYSGEQRILI